MCGGTERFVRLFNSYGGLSPRVRGNRRIYCPHQQHQRSIPACAGNLSQRIRYHHGSRSIPACAGEPGKLVCANPLPGVYPRVCGGTLNPGPLWPSASGLSPRVRGNQLVARLRPNQVGSIPACAGEPESSAERTAMRRVYPRVCGGTRRIFVNSMSDLGLSPRVRGNQCRRQNGRRNAGSIPACAGEPAVRAGTPERPAVYPRVCGGTPWALKRWTNFRGLSPRVRGNRWFPTDAICRRRSIPACAGEPW